MRQDDFDRVTDVVFHGADINSLAAAFGARDALSLVSAWMAEAVADRDRIRLEAALILGFHNEFPADSPQLCERLLLADWHTSHENLVLVIERFGESSSVTALVTAIAIVPDYLDFDDTRALATKAVWALWKLGTDDAEMALRLLVHNPDPRVATLASDRLREWRAPRPGSF